jgi:folylpolyglutamate synthase/dihydropteroate synthase
MKVYMDVGHNHQAISELLKTLERKLKDEPVIFVFGTSGHKKAGLMIDIIQHFIEKRNQGEIYVINGNNPRSKPVSIVFDEVDNADNLKVVGNGNIEATLTHILNDPKNHFKVTLIRI